MVTRDTGTAVRRMMLARAQPGQQDDTDTQEQRPSQLEAMLRLLYERLSDQIAGGARTNVNLLGPLGQEIDPEFEGMLPDDLDFEPPVTLLDPTVFGLADPNAPQGSIAESALQSAISESALQSAIRSSANVQGRAGKGGDWFRTGQAPNNYANRNHPLYKARAQFVADIVAPTIKQLFPEATVTGQNYYRPPGGGGGQAKNSDHQSAGALDIFGPEHVLDAIRDWAIQQPWVSFVRWKSPYHYDHVHISVDIGWVAENFFGGGKATSPVFVNTDTRRSGTGTQRRGGGSPQGPRLPKSPQAQRRSIPRDPTISVE